MTTELLQAPAIDRDTRTWFRIALRECIRFGDHGTFTEVIDGKTVCFDCGWEL
jgi:hypothetical protein